MYSRGLRDNQAAGTSGCPRKPTFFSERKAAVPAALWRAGGTPPGSETRARIHGGSSGTWEAQMFPCPKRCRVSGADSEERTNLRWTFGSLSGT